MREPRRLYILLVEDQPADAQLTMEAFQEAGLAHHLVVVPDGETALHFLHGQGRHAGRRRPDLILLDLNLPKKDGRTVLREIKLDKELKGIPVLVFSTSRRAEDIRESYDLHASGYITKPLHFEELIRVVTQISGFWSETAQLPDP